VTDELKKQIQVDPRDLPPLRRRGSSGLAISLVGFAFIVAGLAYLWLSYGDRIRSAVLDTPPPITAAPMKTAGEDTLDRQDLETVEQQTAVSLRSTIEALEAQKADLKTLSDRVAALSAKLDALQSATASIPVQTPAAAATPLASPRQPIGAQRRKKSSAPKPTGAISVGGAPLPPGQ
jgi:hypothetical protein